MAKFHASFIFECVKMKNTEAYKPTTSIFRLLNEKGSTANLRKEDEFKLTRKIENLDGNLLIAGEML